MKKMIMTAVTMFAVSPFVTAAITTPSTEIQIPESIAVEVPLSIDDGKGATDMLAMGRRQNDTDTGTTDTGVPDTMDDGYTGQDPAATPMATPSPVGGTMDTDTSVPDNTGTGTGTDTGTGGDTGTGTSGGY